MSEVTTTSPLTLLLTSTSNATCTVPYVRPFDETGIAVSAAIIFTFLVVGLFGNILTIIVISTNAKLNDIFMQFILSLCVSDLTSALISWMNLYRRTWGFDSWHPLPDFLCRFYWGAEVLTSYATALHILSFATIRLISILNPIKFQDMKTRNAKIWIVAIWIICFFCGFVPLSIMFGETVPDRCNNEPNSKWPACTLIHEWYPPYVTYQRISFSLFLFVPTIGVVLICLLIGINVRSIYRRSPTSRREQIRRRKERQIVLQLVLIVFSFLIGYMPYTGHEIWTMLPRENTRYNRALDYWLGTIKYFFLRFSECLNPVFYNLGSAKMRSCTADFLQKTFCCSVRSNARPGTKTSAAISSNTNKMRALPMETVKFVTRREEKTIPVSSVFFD